jgi:FtsZ-interacting cell division protein ZipA
MGLLFSLAVIVKPTPFSHANFIRISVAIFTSL